MIVAYVVVKSRPRAKWPEGLRGVLQFELPADANGVVPQGDDDDFARRCLEVEWPLIVV
jgi:hypothetical protein